MTKELKKNIQIIHEHFDYIQKTYNVKKIGVFGSMARGQQRKLSDIDVLVEFSPPVGFFRFLELEDFLSKILNKKVDLVTTNALKPIMKQEILKEVIYA